MPTCHAFADERVFVMAEQQRVSTRVDAEVIEVIRRVAEVERRPPSAVIRIALEDWAASRRAPDNRPEAA